jgi:hypothetical protein
MSKFYPYTWNAKTWPLHLKCDECQNLENEQHVPLKESGDPSQGLVPISPSSVE